MMKDELFMDIYAQAKTIGACSMYRNVDYTPEQLASLAKSVQGVEFCVKHGFPSLRTWRALKGYDPAQYGIYVDAGVMSVAITGTTMFVGRTTATVVCDATARYHIVLLHGAKAIIRASGWAVVKVDAMRGCSVLRDVSDHAIVI